MMPRYAAKRDLNERELIQTAEQLGWWLIPTDEPADFLGCRKGLWHVIEVKNPDCEGHVDEFTAKQRIFHTDAKHRQAPILIWRTVDDVLRDSSARKTA